MGKLLLVEDEHDLSNQVRDWLQREHHTVEVLDNGQVAADTLRVTQYDLIILDWQVPGISGLEVCKQFRNRGGKTPVLMLTARNSVDDREQGLDSGADDYLCKPFHMKELSARVRALIRRAAGATNNVLQAGAIQLDPSARRVVKDATEIHLEPREFALLEFLMRNPNIVFNADALVTRVWETDTEISPDSVRTYIKALRKKLDQKELITTLHGLGYRLNS
ncbi:MAG: response regulator transcription factor [Candidatus Obscuribacterales bacterium]|nr:response regulator transcription factor [Candidatus Obscuribacterales bacterium]